MNVGSKERMSKLKLLRQQEDERKLKEEEAKKEMANKERHG